MLERAIIFIHQSSFTTGSKTKNFEQHYTCKRPSNVRCMVTHLLGCAPLVVMAVMRESSSSFFSFSFLTKLSIARLAKLSLSPPCRWHIRLCTMLKQASLLVGVLVIDIVLFTILGFPLITFIQERSMWDQSWSDVAQPKTKSFIMTFQSKHKRDKMCFFK